MNRPAIRAALALLLTVLLCAGANIAACFIDTQQMRQNAAQGVTMLGEQGGIPQLIGGFKAAQLDNYTSVLILKTAAYTGEETLMQRAFGGTRTDMPAAEGQSTWEAYCTYADGSLSPTGGLTYSRYWHGYTLPLRILLCVMNVSNIQMFLLAVQICLFALVLVLLHHRKLGALFPFHTWSPDGHASAPTAVSMLHAGVLMKLGGYGCFRVAMYLLPEAAHELSWVFIILTTISVVYGAFSACVQTDLKYINAYSSVSHCGLVLFAVLMMNTTAGTGAVLQMLSHGLMTALFFALIGMIYGRTHTRDIRQLGGLMKVMPFLAVGYVIAGLANLGLPGLSGFVAEMTIFNGAFMNADTFHRVVTVIACTSIVITAVYILRVVGKILYGTCDNPEHLKLSDATWDERLSVVCLVVAIAGMGLAPLWVSDMIRGSVAEIIAHILS